MSPSVKRTVFGFTIVLNTILFAFSLFERGDIPAAMFNICVCVVSWIGIYFANASEELDRKLGKNTGEYDDDDE